MSQLVVIMAVSVEGNADEEQNITKFKSFALTPSVMSTSDLIATMRARGSNLVVRSGSTSGPIIKIVEGTPPFLRTKGDRIEKDNLLTLPRF
jgi:uncharacterized hydantoinase/oxoprolinase family protein